MMSLGKHSELHKLVIETLPRFCHGSEVLYVGDALQRRLLMDDGKLAELNFRVGSGPPPDVIAYSKDGNVLYLIEVVHTSNPPRRPGEGDGQPGKGVRGGHLLHQRASQQAGVQVRRRDCVGDHCVDRGRARPRDLLQRGRGGRPARILAHREAFLHT